MGSEAHISGLEIRARNVGRYLWTCEKFEERGAQCLKDDDEFAGGPVRIDQRSQLRKWRSTKVALEGFNLKGLTVSELDTLIERAERERKARKEAERLAVREKVEKLVRDAGMSLDEVIAGPKGKRLTRAKAKPKYSNPANASETWSGRGRKPKWVEAALKGGKKLEDLAIQKAS